MTRLKYQDPSSKPNYLHLSESNERISKVKGKKSSIGNSTSTAWHHRNKGSQQRNDLDDKELSKLSRDELINYIHALKNSEKNTEIERNTKKEIKEKSKVKEDGDVPLDEALADVAEYQERSNVIILSCLKQAEVRGIVLKRALSFANAASQTVESNHEVAKRNIELYFKTLKSALQAQEDLALETIERTRDVALKSLREQLEQLEKIDESVRRAGKILSEHLDKDAGFQLMYEPLRQLLFALKEARANMINIFGSEDTIKSMTSSNDDDLVDVPKCFDISALRFYAEPDLLDHIESLEAACSKNGSTIIMGMNLRHHIHDDHPAAIKPLLDSDPDQETAHTVKLMTLVRIKDFDRNGLFYWLGTSRGMHDFVNPNRHSLLNIEREGGIDATKRFAQNRGRSPSPGNSTPIRSVTPTPMTNIGERSDRLKNSVIVKSSSTFDGSLADITGREHHNGGYFETDDEVLSWVQFTLPDKLTLRPTEYTLGYPIHGHAHIPRNWELQGSIDGELWHVLSSHKNNTDLDNANSSDTITTGENNNSGVKSKRLKSWKITKATPSAVSVEDAMKGVTPVNRVGHYRHFRVLMTGPSSHGAHFLVISFFELYGDVFQEITPDAVENAFEQSRFQSSHITWRNHLEHTGSDRTRLMKAQFIEGNSNDKNSKEAPGILEVSTGNMNKLGSQSDDLSDTGNVNTGNTSKEETKQNEVDENEDTIISAAQVSTNTTNTGSGEEVMVMASETTLQLLQELDLKELEQLAEDLTAEQERVALGTGDQPITKSNTIIPHNGPHQQGEKERSIPDQIGESALWSPGGPGYFGCSGINSGIGGYGAAPPGGLGYGGLIQGPPAVNSGWADDFLWDEVGLLDEYLGGGCLGLGSGRECFGGAIGGWYGGVCGGGCGAGNSFGASSLADHLNVAVLPHHQHGVLVHRVIAHQRRHGGDVTAVGRQIVVNAQLS
eukprot:g1766.t1